MRKLRAPAPGETPNRPSGAPVAHVELNPDTAPDAGIAEPHQSTVTAIRHAARQGRFTSAQAELFIDRIRTHPTAPQSSIKDSRLAQVSELLGAVPISPDRTM